MRPLTGNRLKNNFLSGGLILSVALAGLSGGRLAAADIHVSPDGSDEHPGTFAEPFATLERARDEVRGRVSSMTGDIVVYLHPALCEVGDYEGLIKTYG